MLAHGDQNTMKGALTEIREASRNASELRTFREPVFQPNEVEDTRIRGCHLGKCCKLKAGDRS